MTRPSLSLVGAAVLLATVSAASAAQKPHGGGGATPPAPPHVPMPHTERPAKMDHESAKGEAHEAARAEQRHDKDVPREAKDHESATGEAHEAARAEQRRDKDKAREAKGEDRTEHMALRDAREQSSRLLKGVKLTAAERRQVREIDKKYDAQLKALKKGEKAADKAGGTDNDAAYEAKVVALAAQERADIRAALPASQQVRFDANVMARTTAKP